MTVRDYFNRLAADYDAQAAAAGYASADWLDGLLQSLPACASAVDFGCARGQLGRRLRSRFPGIHLVGVDVAEAMVAAAWATGAYDQVLQHDLGQPPLPLADAGRELALGLGFIEFLPRPELFLAEAARVLAPGGTLFVSFLEHRPAGPQAPQHQVSGRQVAVHAHARGAALALLEAQPLEVVEARSCTGWVADDGTPRPYLLLRAQRR